MIQQADRTAADQFVELFALILDMYFSMSLQEVAHLRVADLLSDGPKSVDILAKQVGVQEDILLLLMRVMCTKDVFIEIEEGVFAHTEKSRLLQTDIPGSMASLSEIVRSDWQRKSWTPDALTYTLQTGKSAFEHVFGESLWDYLAKSPADLAIVTNGMTSLSVALNGVIAEACDLTGRHSLVDIGGGEGSFLATLLSQHPEMTGTVFDLPSVIERTQAQNMGTGLTGRWTCQAGDFFQNVPEGGDAYFLKQILHDWNDEDCLKILSSIRRAIAPSGKLFVIQHIPPKPPNKSTPYLVMSLVLRQWFEGGYQRTEEQLRRLLDQTGFEFVSLTPTNVDNSILQARARE
jgi:hypothetical protein